MSREWVYKAIRSPGVIAYTDRVFQRGSIITAQTVKPYIVYNLGNNTDEGMADEDSFRPNRQFLQVYIHDEVGDFSRIDDIVQALKEGFLTTPRTGDVCGVQYLETSTDLEDPTVESIFRYVRFQLALAR